MTSHEFSGATVVVTGGASGIGRAIVEAVIDRGGRVAALDIDEVQLASLASRFGASVVTERVDVSDYRAVKAALTRHSAALGGFTHLVNNAGIIGGIVPIGDIQPEQLDRALGVNLKSVFYVTSAFLSHRRPDVPSAIVNLSSIAARTGGMPGNSMYAATKGAIASLTISMAKELAPHIRVNALAPGIINTPIQADSLGDQARVAQIAQTIPLRRPGEAREVAEAALWLLSERASYTTGTIVDVAGGR